ncbi:glycosyltransferase [Deinococcus budaensis]|uniref:Glycosyltransferase involved in cell wall biosynthesis n=1 Tax=Deinococcus budaensis TaxID=1665626 RepID=A0A7W8GEX1_9DEIO|nr:glycosyltransferase involved in cell wall biosynthesis [Deinococcus budaensis]
MPRPLRILFVFEGLYGRGAERISLSLISQLDRREFAPQLWVLHAKDATLRDEVPGDIPLRVILRPGERVRHLLRRRHLTLLREAARADVIVATVEIMPTYLAFAVGWLTRTPVVGWVRNSMAQTLAGHSAGHTWLARLIYPRLPRVVFVSRGARRTLQELLPLRPERLRVIHNPVDLERVRTLAAQPLPEWAAWMAQRPTVLSAGRLHQQKGFDLLIEAHARLRAQGHPHELLILGEGDERPNLEALARRLGVEGSVHLPGFVANPYPFMRQAAVYALPSRWEGFANVITEAMACGAPVVAADCPSGPAEILEGGRHGVLVPPENSAALAQALGRLLEDPAEREFWREAGARRVPDFAPGRLVPAWEAVLRETASGRAPQPRPDEPDLGSAADLARR